MRKALTMHVPYTPSLFVFVMAVITATVEAHFILLLLLVRYPDTVFGDIARWVFLG